MLGHIRFATVVAALLSVLVIAPSARAAEPVFGVPATLAGDGSDPSVTMGVGGDAMVAWTGRTSGVFVARRGALGGAFSRPQRVSDDVARAATLTRNASGMLALAWVGRTSPYDQAVVHAAVAPAGQPFGSPEDIPLASVSANAAQLDDIVRPAVTLGPDGSVTVAVTDLERRLLVSQRPAGGVFPQASVLAERVNGDASIAADGRGSVVAAWVQQTADPDPTVFHAVVYAAEVGPASGLGAPRLLSDPSELASNGVTAPLVVANARGDVLVTWAAFPGGMGISLIPSAIRVAERSPIGGWSPTHAAISDGQYFGAPLSAAINDRGDAVVGSYDPSGSASTVFRPAGSSFGSRQRVLLPAGSNGRSVLGVDALGDSVHLSLVGGPGSEPQARIIAATRSGTGPPSLAAVSTAGETESVPDLAFDPFGNGLVVWSSPGAGGGAIRAAAYSAGPPVISGLRVGKREFRLRVNESAAVQVSVRGPRHTKGQQMFLARAGFNRVPIASKLRKTMRRPGRYTVLIRTADAGPRTATMKVHVRRR